MTDQVSRHLGRPETEREIYVCPDPEQEWVRSLSEGDGYGSGLNLPNGPETADVLSDVGRDEAAAPSESDGEPDLEALAADKADRDRDYRNAVDDEADG